MQFLNLLLLLACPLSIIPTQSSSNVPSPPDLIIEKKNWTKSYPPVGGDRDPFAPNDLAREQVLAAREAAIVNRDRLRTGDTLVKPRNVQINTSSLSALRPGIAFYSYTLTVKNVGTKTIRALAWAYVFVDPSTDKQVGRTISVNTAKIRPGKSGEIIGYSNSHPIQVINVKTAAKHTPLKEVVEIVRIEYEDGSVWERPPTENAK